MERMKYRAMVFLTLFCISNSVSSQSIFQLYADASLDSSSGNTYILTPDSQDKTGILENLFPVNLSTNQTFTFSLYFGTNDSDGADGITFFLHRDCETNFGIGQSFGLNNIQPSLFVEFDTFFNDGGILGANDPPEDHMSIMRDGNVNHEPLFWNPSQPSNYVQMNNIEDGNFHNVTVQWIVNNDNTQTIEAEFSHHDGSSYVRTATDDFINTIFNGETIVSWGFSASTGAGTNLQKVQSYNTNNLEYTICEGSSIQLEAPLNGSNYQWTPSTAINNSTISNPIVNPVNSKTYTCNFIDFCGNNRNISYDITVFRVDAGTNMTIPCNTTTTLNSSVINSSNYSVLWTTADGSIVTGSNSLNPTITSAGTYIMSVTENDLGCTLTDVVEITETSTSTTADAGENQYIGCVGFDTATLDGSSSSQGSNYTYLWTSSDGSITSAPTNSIITVTGAGIYYLLVTDTITNCTALANVEVIESGSSPNFELLNNSNIDCINQTITIQAVNTNIVDATNLEYTWSTNDGSITSDTTLTTIEVNSIGTYSLTITDSTNGCSATDIITISDERNPPIPVIDNSTPFNCSVSSVTLDASSSTALNNGPLSYLWSTNDGLIISDTTNSIIDISEPGTYTLALTEYNCTIEESITITDGSSFPLVSINSPTSLECGDTIISLDATNSSSTTSGILSYHWTSADGIIDSGENSAIITVSSAGMYELTTTDLNNNCQTFSSVSIVDNRVFPESIIQTPDEINCIVNTITLNGAASSGSNPNSLSYHWSTPDGTFESINGAPIILASSVGTYSLTVTDISNGCSSSSEVTVIENKATPTIINNSPETLDCSTTNTIIDASSSFGSSSGSLSYQWITSDGTITSATNTSSISVSNGGTYTVTVSDNTNGCSSSLPITVIDNTNNPVISIENPEILNCFVDTITLDASASTGSAPSNLSFNWTTIDGAITSNPSEAIIDVNTSGIYTLVILDSFNGCTSEWSVEVLEDRQTPIPILEIPEILDCITTETILDASNSSGTRTNGLSYLWSTTDGAISSANGAPTLVVSAAGTYTVLITDIHNGCITSSSVIVEDITSYPTISFNPPAIFNCSTTNLTLDASNSFSTNNTNLLFDWSTNNGTIISDSSLNTIEVSNAGNYTLTLTDPYNNCNVTESITIINSAINPTPIIISPPPFDCTIETQFIDASNSVGSSDNLLFEWSSIDGSIISSSNSPIIEINSGGEYQLQITDPTNSCVTTTNTFVIDNRINPTAIVLEPEKLNCTNTSLTIDASTSFGTTANGLFFSWSTLNGNITSPNGAATVVVNQPGTYTLTIIDINNNCSTITDIEVIEDSVPPTVQIETPVNLNCSNSSVFLNASESFGSNIITFQWTTMDGQILSGNNSEIAEVSVAGSYQLLLTDTINGCSTSTSITVFENTADPTILFNTTSIIDCLNPSVTIDASSSFGVPPNDLTFLWETSSGQIDSDISDQTISVSSAGAYSLTVTDNTNGCVYQDTITIQNNTEPPIITIENIEDINCTIPITTLNASNSISSTNSVLDFEWQTSTGNILSPSDEAIISIDTAGTYELIVTDTTNGCISITSISINDTSIFPIADAGLNSSLDCSNNQTMQLNGEGSSQGSNYNYIWTTTDGNILNNMSTLNPLISQAGTYTLTVIDTSNNCSATNQVIIEDNTNLPIADAGSDMFIDCNSSATMFLDGTNSSQGSDFIYEWTTSNGLIIQGENTLNPEIQGVGNYTLTVRNSTNNCEASATVAIINNINSPISDAGTDKQITCYNNQTVILDASNSSQGTNFTYEWTTSNGIIDSGENSLSPVISAVGDYTITTTDTINGCTSVSSVSVTEDLSEPIADIGNTNTIGCSNNGTIELDASNSSVGTNFTYVWSTQDGIIEQNSNTLHPLISSDGTYTLTVTNSLNGCQNSASIVVTENTIAPNADAGLDVEISCVFPTVILNGNNSSGQGDISFFWTTQDGIIENGQNTATPTVSSSGTYQLIVTDSLNGCTDQNSVFVSEDLTQYANAGNDSTVYICEDEYAIDLFDFLGEADTIGEWFGPSILTGGHLGTFSPNIHEEGEYTYVIPGGTICQDVSAIVTILLREPPIIDSIEINDFSENNTVEISMANTGNYLYSINGGLDYQTSNFFENVSFGDHIISVTDSLSCENTVSETIYIMGAPPFFTPNNDGENDTWKIYGMENQPNASIQIYDRFGKIIKIIDPLSNGWNGTLNNIELPAADYWFSLKMFDNNNNPITRSGHFSLVRR